MIGPQETTRTEEGAGVGAAGTHQGRARPSCVALVAQPPGRGRRHPRRAGPPPGGGAGARAAAPPPLSPTSRISQLAAFACLSSGPEACAQGGQPGTLLQASDGNFYGATSALAAPSGNAVGGTIFRVTPSGQLSHLFTFPAGATHTS